VLLGENLWNDGFTRKPYSIFNYMGYKGNKISEAKKLSTRYGANYFSTRTWVSC